MISKSKLKKYIEIFLKENQKYNLISKNDEVFLYEKHIYDSLAIRLFFDKYNIKSANILDIGCGGGFPCVPIALAYPEFNVTGLDSIQKKINAVNNMKMSLSIDNLTLIRNRAENLTNHKYDIIVSRAVASLTKISEYALPLLKKDGYFIAYKSKKTELEIADAKPILQHYNSKLIDIIEYTLPLKEPHVRTLICIKKLSKSI